MRKQLCLVSLVHRQAITEVPIRLSMLTNPLPLSLQPMIFATLPFTAASPGSVPTVELDVDKWR